MDKRFIPVAMLAGALALAGCGGGDDSMEDTSMDDMTMDDDTTMDEEEESTGGTAKLPGNNRIITGQAGLTFTIQPGLANSEKVLDVWYTCTGSEACVVTVPAGSSVSTVSFSGGTMLVASATDPRIVAPAPSAQPESEHWLSAKNLIDALGITSTDFSVATEGGANVPITPLGTDLTNTVSISGTAVMLDHDRAGTDLSNDRFADYLVWGAWQEPRSGGVGSAPTHNQVWGGSVPYTGAPSNQLTGATYSGRALGFYKRGAGQWTNWAGVSRLQADFENGTVKGGISGGYTGNTLTVATPLVGGHIQSVTLKEAAIGSSVSGSVAVNGFDTQTTPAAAPNAPSSGTWEAGFFGAAGDRPTGIAGSFKAHRPESAASPSTAVPSKTHTAVNDLRVNGAFGASTLTALPQ